eukprot:1080082-Rhodomonas_salina.2
MKKIMTKTVMAPNWMLRTVRQSVSLGSCCAIAPESWRLPQNSLPPRQQASSVSAANHNSSSDLHNPAEQNT